MFNTEKSFLPLLVIMGISSLPISTSLASELWSPASDEIDYYAIDLNESDLSNSSVYSERLAARTPLPTLSAPLTNAQSAIMDGISTTTDKNSLTIYNARIKSKQTSLSDYLKISYSLRLSDQKYIPKKIIKYKNIGLYQDPYFVKDVPSNIRMKVGNQTLEMNQKYNLTSTASSIYKMTLTAGQVISFNIGDQSDNYLFKITDPYGEVIYENEFAERSGIITSPTPILSAGEYKIEIQPVNDPTLRFSVKFINANRHSLVSVKDNDFISANFIENLRDYSKYEIKLTVGQKLTVEEPSNPDIKLTLLNNRNAIVNSNQGLSMFYTALYSGKHYLFINNNKGWGGSYRGHINIR